MKEITRNNIIKYLKWAIKFLVAYISIKLIFIFGVFLFFYFHIDTMKFEQAVTDFTIIILSVIAVIVYEFVRRKILR